jgi:molybdopterin-guanine dinucleotide biosynthesis protein A
MFIDDENHSPGPISEVTGLILAGGKSSRYGTNKALVEVDGALLIERVVRVMKAVFQEVILITNTPEDYSFLELPMVGDLIKGLGPVGGIYTGLVTISSDAGFFVACDMPFLNGGLLRHMVKAREGFDAVVPRVGWMLEPLHALYTKSCLPAIKSLIDSHDFQILRCFQKIRVRYMDEEELRAFDPELWSLFNINKPQDLLSAPPCASSSTKDPLPSGGEGRGEGGME